MEIKKYPDGSSYVVLGESIAEYTIRVNSYEDLWHINQLVDACNHKNIIPVITIPNLIDAQADRRFNDRESTGLKLVCKFLNNMNAKFKIFHPHNPEVVEALMDNVEIIDNSNFIKEVLSQIYCEQTNTVRDEGLYYHMQPELSDNLILMSSDAGGYKPLSKLCDTLGWLGDMLSASKFRKDGKVGGQRVPLEDFGGKDILIVDDISVYGGTFKGLAKLLRARNCGRLYLAVSHMTVQDQGEDPVTNYFDKVFTTNSKFEEYTYQVDTGTTGFISVPINKKLKVVKQF